MIASTIARLIATAATLSYCLAAWYLSALWSTLVTDTDAITGLAAFSINPLPLSMEFGMLHWQLIALGSLVICLIWGAKRSKADNENGLALPLLCHYGWLLTALCLHIAGGIDCFVAAQYTLP